MGKAIVELFVHEGASVVAAARRKERLEALAESLKEEPGKIVVYQGDVSKIEDVEGMIDEAIKQFGKLDVLVNNAGIMDDMPRLPKQAMKNSEAYLMSMYTVLSQP